jgi:RNA polymerase sigma factor (sigma-70 family)
MTERDWLAEEFEEHRTRLRGVAYRMLGSLSEADDAVQEAWLRLSRTDAGSVENLGAWLTTVVARVSLNMLRSRRTRDEQPLGVHVPDPIVDRADGTDPEHEALLADSVGLALLVVLETLTPAERLAFVLHDMFAVPFVEIAPIVGRSPEAARQLASRARRRVQGENAVPDADIATQREIVAAFLAAAREGDFEGLLAVLDPDVVLRADLGPLGGSREVRGAEAVMGQARAYARLGLVGRPALINGAAGLVATRDGEPFSVGGFTIRNRRIVAIDILADPERLRGLDLTILDAWSARALRSVRRRTRRSRRASSGRPRGAGRAPRRRGT